MHDSKHTNYLIIKTIHIFLYSCCIRVPVHVHVSVLCLGIVMTYLFASLWLVQVLYPVRNIHCLVFHWFGTFPFGRVLLCLKRALRIANAAQQMATATRGSSGSVSLFIEILNKYVLTFLILFILFSFENFRMKNSLSLLVISGIYISSKRGIQRSVFLQLRAWLS